jgi:hypothetical protein
MNHPICGRLLALALLAPLVPLGCAGGSTAKGGNTGGSGGAGGGGGGDGGAASSANSQACQLFKGGQVTAVTGETVYTFKTPVPPVLNDRKVYRVTLPGPSQMGYVGFKVPANGEYVVFTNRMIPVTLYTWDGTMLASKTIAGSVSECQEVKNRESFDLLVDSKPHVIKFGPGSEGTVDLVLTTASP